MQWLNIHSRFKKIVFSDQHMSFGYDVKIKTVFWDVFKLYGQVPQKILTL